MLTSLVIKEIEIGKDVSAVIFRVFHSKHTRSMFSGFIVYHGVVNDMFDKFLDEKLFVLLEIWLDDQITR